MENTLSSSPLPKKRSKVFLFALLGIIIILIIAAAFYLLSSLNLFGFKTLATLSYDVQKATQALQDPQTIVLTKGADVMLSDLKEDELILVPSGNNFSQKMANFRISHSRNYITWQSEAGIVGLDIAKRQVFLIYQGEPRQSFDLSPLEDKILFVTKDKLLEVDLTKASTQKRLQLPKLDNPKVAFNHVKYSPNGQVAYIRSIHEIDNENFKERIADVEMAIVSFEANSINLLKEALLTSIDLAPVWSVDSGKLFTWRDGLIAYELGSQNSNEVLKVADFPSLKPYAVNPADGSFVYIKGQNYDAEKPWLYNPEIALVNQEGQNLGKLLDTKDARFGKEVFGALSDVGWLDGNTIWFTYSRTSNIRDLWTIQKDGSGMTKVLDNVDQYSLDSVAMPITNAYTLYP